MLDTLSPLWTLPDVLSGHLSLHPMAIPSTGEQTRTDWAGPGPPGVESWHTSHAVRSTAGMWGTPQEGSGKGKASPCSPVLSRERPSHSQAKTRRNAFVHLLTGVWLPRSDPLCRMHVVGPGSVGLHGSVSHACPHLANPSWLHESQ